MEKIKFRSAHYNYDGTFNGFSYWGAIDRFGSCEPTSNGFCSPTSRSETERKFEEQYSTCNDKNGKEIFEGDIIKCQNQNCVVIFGKKTFGFGYHFKYKTSWNEITKFYRLTTKDVVIGNIHENPKLLR